MWLLYDTNWWVLQSDCIIYVLQKEESGLVARGKDEMESGSGSEHIEGGLSGNEQEAEQQQQTKKKRYHRHTARQIQEMETYESFSLSSPFLSLKL